jgi:hypothetical protein
VILEPEQRREFLLIQLLDADTDVVIKREVQKTCCLLLKRVLMTILALAKGGCAHRPMSCSTYRSPVSPSVIRADEDREGYISTKPNITPVFPFGEDGIRLNDVYRILDESGIGIPKYYEWRSRSGCYFCFFQRKAEWAGLKERHPEQYEQAKAYENIVSFYM